MDESRCFYVGSRGLLKSCIHHSPKPNSTEYKMEWEIPLHLLKDGDSIYICSSALSDFVNRILPNIRTKFVLVTGDSDYSITANSDFITANSDYIPANSGSITADSDYIPVPSHDFDFISDPRLLAWFSQNLVSSKPHPKVKFLPIGLDYHTMANNDMYWGAKTSPKTQEDELFAVAKKSRPFFERIPFAYTTFHFAIHRGSRWQAYHEIPKDLVYYEPNQITRLESWTRQIEYAFVLSPPGEGLDCHRTWEALCLGCIPIVCIPNFKQLFEDLPILMVDNWSQITVELLQTTIEQFREKVFNYDKLTLNYWTNRIKNGM